MKSAVALIAAAAMTIIPLPPPASHSDAIRYCRDRGLRLADLPDLLRDRDKLLEIADDGLGDEAYWFWTVRSFEYNSTERFGWAVDVRDGTVFRRYRTNRLQIYCVRP